MLFVTVTISAMHDMIVSTALGKRANSVFMKSSKSVLVCSLLEHSIVEGEWRVPKSADRHTSLAKRSHHGRPVKGRLL